MAQQSARRGRKNQMNPSCLEHAFMIWFRSANSHTGPQLHRCIRGRTDGSIRLRADILQKPLASRGASTDGLTPFCNGPVDVKCPHVIVTPPGSRFCPWSTLGRHTMLSEGAVSLSRYAWFVR
jgi:hypothetical protein